MPRARIAAEAPETSSVEAEIARLRGLDIEALRARWRTVFGGKAPRHLPRHLLFAIIAYRLQAEVLGDSNQIVDRRHKCSKRFARTGRRGDKCVAASLDQWPRLCLCRRGYLEVLVEPRRYGWMEQCPGKHVRNHEPATKTMRGPNL